MICYCPDEYVQQLWTRRESIVHFWSHISSEKPHGELALCFVKQGPCLFFVVFFYSLRVFNL